MKEHLRECLAIHGYLMMIILLIAGIVDQLFKN